VDIGFDNADRLHAVWSEDMGGGIWHLDGTVIQPDMFVLIPFGAVGGNPAYRYDHPFIFRNDFDTGKMYVHALETASGADYKALPAQWDLAGLPGQPTVMDLNKFQTASAAGINRDQVDVLSVGNYMVYAVETYPNIEYNVFDVAGNSWNTTAEVVGEMYEIHNPRLAKDASGYVYLAYEQYDGAFWSLRIRRSLNPLNMTPVLDLNTTSFQIFSSDSGSYNAELAVTGPGGAEKVALVYQDPDAATGIEIACSMAQSMNWGGTSWTGTTSTINFLGSASLAMGPGAAYDANGNTLYVVWSDNRIGYDQLYGMTSYDGGLTFNPEELLLSSGEYIVERPVVTTGTQPGTLAVAYMRTGGGGTSPYVLASMPTFYDTCDVDPGATGFWTASPGVTSIDPAPIIPVSPPKCYEMANADGRGQLLRDFGTQEHTGSVDLYFYDDDDPSIGEDFFVGMENTNARGVIRMLGVKNDTSTTNYAYTNELGVWVDWGVPRSTGWHRIIMTVDETTGLTMSLEYQPGITAEAFDPAFTGFTSITIEGGSTGEPYLVDDIQVIAIPLIGEMPLPSATPATLVLMLLGIGILILWKIRY